MQTVSPKLYLNGHELLEARLAESLGLDRYAYLQKQAPVVNVTADKEFQRVFNGFYKVRKNAGWREHFFSLMERAKKEGLIYDDVIKEFLQTTDMVEASFASKLIATLNDSCPIIDQYVLKNLGLSIVGSGKDARCQNAIDVYYRICDWYDDYLETQEAKANIVCFNNMLPQYAWISDVKKIDYLIWTKR